MEFFFLILFLFSYTVTAQTDKNVTKDKGASNVHAASNLPDTAENTTEVFLTTTVKKLKMYQMWKFRNFENVPTYVSRVSRGLTRSTTKEPTNGEGDYKIIEIKGTRTNSQSSGGMAKEKTKSSLSSSSKVRAEVKQEQIKPSA
uniref:Uncharacterized protein n=1 Tax=Clastoptera arizonana TaxID=38151 RepID=A0A1B6CUE7_9HEMI